MNLRALMASALLLIVLAAVTLILFQPEVGMNKPIKLDRATYADDFGPWLDTLPLDQQAVITGYVDRWDTGELKPKEPDWSEAEVTPRDLIKGD